MPSLDVLIPACNAEHHLDTTLGAIFDKPVPDELEVGVIVVDNRSTDGTRDVIDGWASSGVQRVDCMAVQGRAAARNAGAAASSADYLLLLDADCRLLDEDCFTVLSHAMTAGVDAGFGFATGIGTDFWGRYARRLEAQRLQQAWRGWTSACLLIRRNLFNGIGGFCEEYVHYGFEDRDLVCTLRSVGEPLVLQALPGLRAAHDGATTAATVFAKMYEAARYSSAVFRRRHAAAYAELGYARVDSQTATAAMALLLRALSPLRAPVSRVADRLAAGNRLPPVTRRLVKLGSALSYFRGTVDRDKAR